MLKLPIGSLVSGSKFFSSLEANQLRYTLSSCSSVLRCFSTSCVVESRIKTRRTHKPFWHVKKTNKATDSPITGANKKYLDRVVEETYSNSANYAKFSELKERVGKRDDLINSTRAELASLKIHRNSPLRHDLAPVEGTGEWKPSSRRCGLIGRKIGQIRMWNNKGKTVVATAIQVEDNHVIKYIPLEQFKKGVLGERRQRPTVFAKEKRTTLGVLIVGALSANPATLTKDYCGLFTQAGVMPKKKLTRIPVSEEAILAPGTPLYAAHFEVGQVIDILGRTMRRGFQGCMVRHGYHGMPSGGINSVNKSHRRPGNTGSGRSKGRVWPGQPLPGHMGGNFRRMKGLRILRINHTHNIIFVAGVSVPGDTGEFVQIFDTVLPEKKLNRSPRFFPTCSDEQYDKLPSDEYADYIHQMDMPTILATVPA